MVFLVLVRKNQKPGTPQTCIANLSILDVSGGSGVSLQLQSYRRHPATTLQKKFWHRCFPMTFAKISNNTFSYRTPPVAAFINIDKLYKELPCSIEKLYF